MPPSKRQRLSAPPPVEPYSDDADSEEDEWATERVARTAGTHDDADDDEEGVAQFEDDEEVGEEYGESEDEETFLKQQISTIPFTSLLKAQRKLSTAKRPSGSSDDDDDEPEASTSQNRNVSLLPGATKAPFQSKRKNGSLRKADRASKHAPMEMSSKKAVGRKREVVEVVKKQARDPRFEALSGSFKPDLFKKSYAFLQAAHSTELETLRATAKAARKNVALPEEEKAKIESALRTMESRDVERRRKERESEALRAWKKEEEQKRSEGKGEFYLKKAEKKKVLLKAKYEALSGDKKQLRKSVEKRRKKTAQKEKKLIPRERVTG